MASDNHVAARADTLPTWPVHEAAMAVLPALVRAELHLRRLAGPRAAALSERMLQVFEGLIDAAQEVECYTRRWEDAALAAIAEPLASALTVYERAGDGVASEHPAPRCGHGAEEPRHAPDFAEIMVRHTGDDGMPCVNAGKTWGHACDAVARGTDPREVAAFLSREVTNDDDWRNLRQVATGCAAAGWQAATAPGTVLRAALAAECGDGWWTGPADSPVHIAASSLLALVENHQALMQALRRLIPAAEAHATDAGALADEVADDPDAMADEKQGRRLHATETAADITFALHTLKHAKGLR